MKWSTKFLMTCALIALVVGPAAAGPNSGRPSSDIVVITNWGSDSISLLNVKTAQHLGTVDVGPKPYDVKVDPSGKFAWVACSGSNFISRVDLIAKLEQKDRRIAVGDSPRDMALSRDGTRAVVANSGSDDVSVVDLVAGKELYRIGNVGSGPYGVALTDDDRKAVITLYTGNKVAILEIGAAAGKIIGTVDVAGGPYTVATSKNGRFAFVTCFNDGVVSVVDLQAMKGLTPVKVGKSPWGLAMSLDGKIAVVANFNSQDISILAINDAAPDPIGGASPPLREDRKISVIDKDPIAANSPAKVLRKPKNAVLGSDPNRLILTDLATNEVALVDLATNVVLSRVKVGQAPYGVDFIPLQK